MTKLITPRIDEAEFVEIDVRPAPRSDRHVSEAEIKMVIERAIAPLESWPTVDNPENYIESRLGKYIKLLEGMLDRALVLGHIDRAQSITNDLIRLSKLGRAKAEVNINGPSKLRDEINFRDLTDSEVEVKLKEIKDAVDGRRASN